MQVIESVQHGGPVVLAKGALNLASLSQYENAWGLPHVLACVCCKGKNLRKTMSSDRRSCPADMSGTPAGIEIIRSVISADLPRSFYPDFRPSDPDPDGYSVEVLPSLQVNTL